MALLNKVPGKASDVDRDTLRIFPVTAKLTKEERKAVTEFARSHGIARGQWISV